MQVSEGCERRTRHCVSAHDERLPAGDGALERACAQRLREGEGMVGRGVGLDDFDEGEALWARESWGGS
jgi:hypothetical protein